MVFSRKADRILKKAIQADDKDDQLRALGYYKSAVDLYRVALRCEEDIKAHNSVSAFSKVSPAESDRFIAALQSRITKFDARRKVLRLAEMKGELLQPKEQEE